jgi:hypothetical protein
MSSPNILRKRRLAADGAASASAEGELDIASCAAIAFTSEDPLHPVDHMLDGSSGPRATVGPVHAPTRSSKSCWSSISHRSSRSSNMRSKKRHGSVPRKCAWKSPRMEAERIAKF